MQDYLMMLIQMFLTLSHQNVVPVFALQLMKILLLLFIALVFIKKNCLIIAWDAEQRTVSCIQMFIEVKTRTLNHYFSFIVNSLH